MLFTAFSSESFVRASALAAQHVALMRAPAGWCPLSRGLTRYPVVLATDVPDETARAAVRAALTPLGGRSRAARFEIQLLGSLARPLGGIPAPYHGVGHGGGGSGVAAWKWWRPALYMHSPFRVTLSLDTDAIPCSTTSVASAFAAFARLFAAHQAPLAAPQCVQHTRALLPSLPLLASAGFTFWAHALPFPLCIWALLG